MSSRQFKIVSLFFVYLMLFVSNSNAQSTIDAKHVKVSLRMIGHQVLLNVGDSTSRVLPIIKENGYYKIQFESEFEFSPGDLVNIVNTIIKETNLASGYIMEVEKCQTSEVVYSYEIGDLDNIDIIPCKTRNQPKACYNLLFTLIESQEDGQSIIAVEEPAVAANLAIYITATLVVFTIFIFFFLWKTKNKTTLDPNLIALGKYHFDKRNAELILEEQRIELTSKEADLLLLLYKTVNHTVERELILNVVWGDEGDYVGRTLDVFISKLRKKLEADPSVKIVNIRGVGYKLVVQV